MTRIGLYHGPLYRGAQGYETYGPFARYIAEFARHFDEVVVFAPVTTDDTHYRGCDIPSKNVRVVELPFFETHLQAIRKSATILRTFRREIDRVDVINCRNTAPFGHRVYRMARRRGIGFFYHFTSDPWEILQVGPKYRGLFGAFARTLYRLDFIWQKRVMRRTYSFINGRLPYERLRPITDRMEPVISSTLTASDFRDRTSFTLHDPPRLLYVGYLKHMKGLGDLLEALRILMERDRAVNLHLVGAGPEESALRGQVRRLGVERHVVFHRYVPMGDALNRLYEDADLFVFPSLSEGSPRVVLEAMAHALPIVATPVGSVPELIPDGTGGLIVPARDPRAIASAVERFLDDETLRTSCGHHALSIARQHTVDRFIAPMVQKAKELARRGGSQR